MGDVPRKFDLTGSFCVHQGFHPGVSAIGVLPALESRRVNEPFGEDEIKWNQEMAKTVVPN